MEVSDQLHAPTALAAR